MGKRKAAGEPDPENPQAHRKPPPKADGAVPGANRKPPRAASVQSGAPLKIINGNLKKKK